MSSKAQKIGSVLKYSALPEILPRVVELFASGFAHLAYFMAQVYRAVRLLPANHPYLLHSNMGRYSLWNVVGEARRNLVFKWTHLDQLLVFASLFVGIVLMVLQFAMLILAFIVPDAEATGAYWARFFVRDNPENDLAFVTLDRVFGVPDIFNSRISTAAADGPFPSPFHLGLQELFSYYSIGVFAIAILIIIYYIITIVGETAVTGTPFGKRFNGAWAPVRLMLAIALLAPISSGMNIAQLGTLRVAKWGSNLASNGWVEFNTAMGTSSTALGDPESLIAQPIAPALNTFLEWALVAGTCVHMHRLMYDRTIEPYVVQTRTASTGNTGAGFALLAGTDYMTARTMGDNDTITIVVGEQNDEYVNSNQQIRPICGSLTIKVQDVEEEGAVLMQQRYYEWVQDEIELAIDLDGEAIALRFSPTIEKDPASNLPDQDYLKNVVRAISITRITNAIAEAREAQIAGSDWQDRAEELGWAGAGMWYNKVAQHNGTLFSAVYNMPQPQLYPEVMEYTRLQRMSIEEQVQPRDRYRPYRADDDPNSPGGTIEYRTQGDFYLAQALYFAQQLWADNYIASTQNPILDYVNMVFGTTGLFNMRANIELGVHPMAALVGIGSSLVESSVMSVGAFALGGVLGGIGNAAGNAVIQKVGESIRGISFQLAVLGLSLGFILFYVLPFLPFIYFFFAFSGWIKAVFEAMVGLPLWALAHLRIDGEGINGPHTMDGFFLVFEIFIRPIVIIIALVSSVAVFSAMINVLNSIWDLVVTNLVGNTPPLTGGPTATPTTTTGLLEAARGTIDYLFYTVIYAIFVYLIGLSSFKLIDLIPNYTLRWMGKSIKTIGEGELGDDPGQSILQNMYGGSQVMMSQFQQNSALSSLLGRH